MEKVVRVKINDMKAQIRFLSPLRMPMRAVA